MSISSYAQNFPIWESNFYTYNKANFGRDFLAVEGISIDPSDGSVYFLTNAGEFFQLRNNAFSKIPWVGSVMNFIKHIHFNGKKLYVFEKIVLEELPDGSLRKFDLLQRDDERYGDFLSHNGKIYYALRSTKVGKDKLKILVFDGKEVKTILEEKNTKWHKLYLVEGKVVLSQENANETINFLVDNDELVEVNRIPGKVLPIYFSSLSEFYFLGDEKLKRYTDGKITTLSASTLVARTAFLDNIFTLGDENKWKQIYLLSEFTESNKEPKAQTSALNSVFRQVYSAESNSFYVSSSQNMVRFFPFIKKYPRLFRDKNSESIHSLSQTADGRVWVGSYTQGFAVIDNEKVTNLYPSYKILPGSTLLGGELVANVENLEGTFLLNKNGKMTRLSDFQAYYSFVSNENVFYLGVYGVGMRYKKVEDLKDPTKPWQFVDKEEKFPETNGLCITEDNFGNIWSMAGRRGVLVFQPETENIHLFDSEKDTRFFGGMSLFRDSYGTIWFGSRGGELIYWNGKNKNDFNPDNFVRIKHPFLQMGNIITFITQWENWLVIGAYDKVLLFDLEAWYKSDKQKSLVRYLSHMELNFSGNTEQNTVLIDSTDQSVWFATSDMLYRWNIRDWLKLPIFKVVPEIRMKVGDDVLIKPNEDNIFHVKPTQNSFHIEINYQSKDNMPRYLTAQLIKKGEKAVTQIPNTEMKYYFQNLESGDYTFHIVVCQQDGSYETFEYAIYVDNFIWAKWWFWALALLLPVYVLVKELQTRKKIEKQQKEIAQLNLLSLGKQFRPHFMLNALNSLGADMHDKPHAERIISRIGENITIIHRFSRDNQLCISFADEWKLTLNTIEIHKEIFIKALQTEVINIQIIDKRYQLPIGIIQMIVENALLHGVRHRKKPPHLLKIEAKEDDKYYYITISDNGVGMSRSKDFYEFERKGTGLSNIASLISIINSYTPDAFQIKMSKFDLENVEYPGTQVVITMKKVINYGNIMTLPPPPPIIC